jgi:hypothetical protein
VRLTRQVDLVQPELEDPDTDADRQRGKTEYGDGTQHRGER